MAQRSPGKLRSPRNRAIDIGTDPGGFPGDLPYDVKGGHPVTPDTPERVYQEQPPAVSVGGTPIQGNPIKLGG